MAKKKAIDNPQKPAVAANVANPLRSDYQPPTMNRSGLGVGPHKVPCAVATIYADGKPIKNSELLSIHQSSGWRSLDRATFEVKLTAPVTDIGLFDAIQEIYVVANTFHPSGSGPLATSTRTMFWGKTSGVHVELGGERVVIEAAQAPYHYGDMVAGMWEMNPQIGKPQLLERELVFNPTFDATSDANRRNTGANSFGITRGNMDPRTSGKGSYKLFLDPLRVFTASAREFNTDGQEVTTRNYTEAAYLKSDLKWTLAEIVYYLCWTCNEKQENFINPSRKELEFLDKSEDLVHDLRIPLGEYLPEALDRALNQYGYSWFIRYRSSKDRRITIFKRGVGEQKKISWQHYSQRKLLPVKTTANRMDLHVGYQSMVNEVTVIGDHKLWEYTFELKRAWAASADNTDEGSLTLGDPSYISNSALHRVWRDWVLNEAGDYNGLREGYETFDLKEVVKHEVTPRRRRFRPCITLETDRLPMGVQGYFIEWSSDGGTTWYPLERLDNRSVEILNAECGIRFSGSTPPIELRDAGDNAKVRITCSIYDDERVKYTAKRNKKSVQPAASAMLIDKPDFFFRQLSPDSQFRSRVNRGDLLSSQVDDTLRCKELAERIVNAWDQLDVSGSATLAYFNTEDRFEVGDVLVEVVGRKIDLDIFSPAEKRYPQVTGVTLDFQNQTQTLAIETFRDTRFV